jgi:iron complex outermembrane receptor protein
MNPMPPWLPGLLAALAALPPSGAQAEPTPVAPAAVLPEITVTGTDGSLTVPSATQAREQIEQTPGGVAMVDAEDYEQTRAVTIKDMLDYVPGVYAQPRYAEELRLSIRGSGLSRTFHLRGIGLFQDGIPINLADGGGDFQDIDPLAFQYVEVFKGANALELGTAALGGAINFVTPTGRDADRLKLRLEGGSFNTGRAQIATGGVVGDGDYYLSLSHLRSDGYRDFMEQGNTRLFSNAGYRLSEDLETRFYLTYGDINQEIPGSLSKAQLEDDPAQANLGNVRNNYQRDYEILRVANKTTWRGDGQEISGGVYAVSKQLYHPIFQLIDQDAMDYGAYATWRQDGELAGRANRLTVGTRLGTGDTDSRRYVNLAGDYGDLTSNAREQSRNAALFAENRTELAPGWTGIIGAQGSYAERDYDDRFLSDGDRSGTKTYRGLSPRLGLLWDAVETLQLFANVSQAVEPPTFSELTQSIPGVSGLADIDAQRSTTLEVGSRGEWQAVSWDASLYRSWVRDELMFTALGDGGQSAVLNTDKTVHQGVELGLGARLAEFSGQTLTSRIAYTYSDFKFDGDPQWGDNQIPGIPEHYLRAELRYRHPAGFALGPNVEWVPEAYPIDFRNSLETDAYALLGLTASYEISSQIEIFLDARNLTDEKYAATTGLITEPAVGAFGPNTVQFIPGDGRAVYAGLTMRW